MKVDTERIEKILKDHFPLDEPEGARDRILSRAARELRPARSRLWVKLQWAFAVLAVGTILLANISDHTRQVRVAGGNTSTIGISDRNLIALARRQNLNVWPETAQGAGGRQAGGQL
jgi:hypothetical protein